MRKLSFLLISLALLSACGTQPEPLTKDETPSKEELSSVASPSALSDAGANLASPETPAASSSEQVSVKSFYVTASHSGFNPSMITVKIGDTVKLTLESIDTRHSFSIPALGVRAEIPARDTTTLEFIATLQGQFEFLSDVYSGENTENLRGVLLVN
ncbi:MAG: cupredoxin domain-containing protein [Candidatus Gracilibacteria bacterium]|nr:cupredoxin domain-containing protein [Candidatus Gracilibacteria bacterium]